MKKYFSVLAFLFFMVNWVSAVPVIYNEGKCNDPNDPHYGLCHWSVWDGDVCLLAVWADCIPQTASGANMVLTPGTFYDFSNEPIIKQGIEAYNKNLITTRSKKRKIDITHLQYGDWDSINSPKDKPRNAVNRG